MPEADVINANPMAIAIISDMTTFVHTGDLFALTPEQGIMLIELKTGKKNIEFSTAAEFSVLSECSLFDEIYTKSFNKTDLDHYHRSKRQITRAKNVIDAIVTGQGFDNFHQSKVTIHDKNFSPNFFTAEIINLWQRIYNGKSWAITDINECLFIGAYSKAEIGFCGFNTWMKTSKFSGKVYNLLDSFSDPLSRPFFSLNLPDKLLYDIINGNLIIVLCLDIKLFMKRANKKHPGLYYHTEPPPKTADTPNILSVGDKYIATDINGIANYVGNGIETRIIFDQHYPDSLIGWAYKMSDIKKRRDKQNRATKKEAKINIKERRKRSRPKAKN
jgi:hypothetical protein